MQGCGLERKSDEPLIVDQPTHDVCLCLHCLNSILLILQFLSCPHTLHLQLLHPLKKALPLMQVVTPPNLNKKEVFTLPPLFRADSGRTLTDSTYPECQFFGSGIAGIVR